MCKNLMEAITINNADYIGTARGYDLFDIKTYDAAQQFVVENTTTPAGQAYISGSEATFNTNINQNQHLYFFVKEDTNKVFAGIVTGHGGSTIDIVGKNSSVNIAVNFLFEVSRASSANNIFPLFLIPGIQVADSIGNLIIKNNVLLAVLPQLTPEEDEINIDLTSIDTINSIHSYAFCYSLHINSLILGDNIKEMLINTSFEDIDQIQITWAEKPANWADDWDNGYENKIEYLHAEEIENIKQQRQQEIELERQRAEEAEKQRIEQEQRDILSNINYKVEGKGITILGLKPQFKGEIIIPEKINNLPVTKIASFAFYRNTNVEKITLPNSIKLIGEGAFAYTELKERPSLPQGCITGKNIFYRSIRRS